MKCVIAAGLAFVFLGCAWTVHCRVVGAFVMPHGGIALDPAHFNSSNATSKAEAWQLHDACKIVGSEVARLAPDIVLLSTPHGIADLTAFQFYLDPQGFGWADTDNCGCPPCCYNVSVTIAANTSLKIVGKLKNFGAQVSGLAAYGPPGGPDGDPFPLRWGEVIPLHFLVSLLPVWTRVMVLSQPSRRYTESVAMIPELLKLGSLLFQQLEAMEERVVVVISADLAHTHQKSGPYGYSNASEPYDLACGEWASSLNSTALLVTAASLVDRALSCGYTGLVMLHGMMDELGLDNWRSKLYANYHPSYYGMMVASFLRETAGQWNMDM